MDSSQTALRVGVVTGEQPESIGGGWTFTAALKSALDRVQTRHKYIVVDQMVAQAVKQDSASAASQVRRLIRDLARRTIPVGLRSTIARKWSHKVDAKNAHHVTALVEQQGLDIVWYITLAYPTLPLPFISTVWDLEHRKQPYFPEVSVSGWTWTNREKYFAEVLPRASFIIVGTHAGKDEIVHFYNVSPANVRVIPSPTPVNDLMRPPLDGRTLRDKLRLNGDYLFYPAQFWPHKNHINLLLALDILRKRHRLRLNLVFTGSDKGNRDYVNGRVRQLGLSDQVFDLGFVPRDELNALYANALALVYPSFFGTDNLPPLEAFSLNCPVTASDIPGAKEQLRDGALFFDPTNPDDMADKIFMVCSDMSLRKQLIEAGAKIALERRPENYIAKIEAILDEFAVKRRCWDRNYVHPP
jgi:glycosyltransferase involved in cell wall biosynthesis